jgi:hypothetical protein
MGGQMGVFLTRLAIGCTRRCPEGAAGRFDIWEKKTGSNEVVREKSLLVWHFFDMIIGAPT